MAPYARRLGIVGNEKEAGTILSASAPMAQLGGGGGGGVCASVPVHLGPEGSEALAPRVGVGLPAASGPFGQLTAN